MLKKYILFTTPSCPKCPAVKAFVKSLDIEGTIIDAAQHDGLEKAREFGVSSVPTAIFFDDKEREIRRAHSVEEIKKIIG